MADEIIKELWQIKDRIAYEHSYDLDALVAYLRSRKHIGTYRIVDLRAMKETAEQSH
jgi:hypothetical protein